MNFCTDRDLLACEPQVFTDVPLLSQQRLHVNDAKLTGTILQSATAQFTATGIGVGHVVLLDGQALEVTERVDANTLSVSLLRARLTDAPIPGEDGENLDLKIRSFEPQITLVHDILMRLLAAANTTHPANPNLVENNVLSVANMVLLEMHGALERIYSGVIALTGDNEALLAKAAHHRTQFRSLLSQTTIEVTSENSPHTRRVFPGVGRLIRS